MLSRAIIEICDIFINWEDVKDEILLPDRKKGSGNGTVHIYLLEDNMNMYFKGSCDKDYAYLEVSLFGTASDAAYDRLTAALSEIVNEELGIDRANIYIKYEEAEHWGWNGSNF